MTGSSGTRPEVGPGTRQMVTQKGNRARRENGRSARRSPPGRTRIVRALRMLLAEKDFSTVTTAEIAREAGVTEALIYKYFKDKRDLLYQVLAEYLEEFLVRAEMDLKGIEGAFNKLRKIIWSHINVYATNRVFAKILLLEVRSYSDYYRSRPYEMVRQYSGIVRDVVREGIESGEIRNDIQATMVEQCLLGCMEHVCMTGVVFDRAFSPDELTENLCKFVFAGLQTSRGQA